MKFTDLDLHPRLLESLNASQFTDCTPIQAEVLPLVLQGKDVGGLAQTGTGKTGAYLIPLLDRLYKTLREEENSKPEKTSPSESNEAAPSADLIQGQKASNSSKERVFSGWKQGHYILVLVPTRELADQVLQNLKMFSQGDFQGAAIYGGMAYEPQKQALNRGVEFIIATPGRLIDLFHDHCVDLSQARAIIFDEADRMFDMGFKDDMKFILKRVPRERQFLVFSATLNFDVMNVAYEFGAHPIEVDVSRDQAKAENVEDEIFHTGQSEKPQMLLSLLRKFQPRQAIVFSNFKSNVDRIADFLSKNEYPAMGISSLMSQPQRQRVMAKFKAEGNNKNILVATDVAARGLDIQGVDLVINFDLPDDAENYVHRIGRTGRAGEKGKAFSLVSDRDVEALERIQTYLENKVPIGWLEDELMVKEFVEFPADVSRKSHRSKDRPYGDRPAGGASGKGGRSAKRSDSRRSSSNNDRPDRPQKGRSHGGERRSSESRSNKGTTSTPPRASSEAVKATVVTQKSSAHRDRLTGRHRPKKVAAPAGAATSAGEASAPHSPKNKISGGKKKHLSNSKSRQKYVPKSGGAGATHSAPRGASSSASVGQKVSRFFKKLFS